MPTLRIYVTDLTLARLRAFADASQRQVEDLAECAVAEAALAADRPKAPTAPSRPRMTIISNPPGENTWSAFMGCQVLWEEPPVPADNKTMDDCVAKFDSSLAVFTGFICPMCKVDTRELSGCCAAGCPTKFNQTQSCRDPMFAEAQAERCPSCGTTSAAIQDNCVAAHCPVIPF